MADADYVLALKGNHETAHEEISEYLDDLVAEKQNPVIQESRHCPQKCGFSKAAVRRKKATGVKPPGTITRVIRSIGSRKRANGKDSRASEWCRPIPKKPHHHTRKRYYLCSIDLAVKEFAKAVSGHWGVENSCRWVMDIIFKEDESRARTAHAAQNLGTTRRLAMNLVGQENSNKRGIKGRVKRAGWDNTYLEKILTN